MTNSPFIYKCPKCLMSFREAGPNGGVCGYNGGEVTRCSDCGLRFSSGWNNGKKAEARVYLTREDAIRFGVM